MRVDLGCRARREERRVASHTSDEQHARRQRIDNYARCHAPQSGPQHPCANMKSALNNSNGINPPQAARFQIILGTVRQERPLIDRFLFSSRIMCADPVRFSPPPQAPANTEINPQKKPQDEPPEPLSGASKSSTSALTILDKTFRDILLSKSGNQSAIWSAKVPLLKQKLDLWTGIDSSDENFDLGLKSIIQFITQQPDKGCRLYLINEALDFCKGLEGKSDHKNAIYVWFFFFLNKKTPDLEPQHHLPFALELFQLQRALPPETQKKRLFAWTSFLPNSESRADQWQWITQLKDAFSEHGESMNLMERYVSQLIKLAANIEDKDKVRLLGLVHDLLDICENWTDEAKMAEAISAIWLLNGDQPQDNSDSATAGKSLESFFDEKDHLHIARRILSLRPVPPPPDEPEIWSTIRAFAIPDIDSGEAS